MLKILSLNFYENWIIMCSDSCFNFLVQHPLADVLSSHLQLNSNHDGMINSGSVVCGPEGARHALALFLLCLELIRHWPSLAFFQAFAGAQ